MPQAGQEARAADGWSIGGNMSTSSEDWSLKGVNMGVNAVNPRPARPAAHWNMKKEPSYKRNRRWMDTYDTS